MIKIKEYGVAIYGENSAITNNGTIINAIGNNTGIYGVGGSINNTGTIALSEESNGMYLSNGTSLINNGNITVGNTKSSGIYGSGTTNVYHNSGIVTVGKDSVGVASDAGDLVVLTGAQIIAGENSTSIYTVTGTGKNYQNLILDKYGVGMHTKSGVMENYATITLGESSISETPMKISMGMATEDGYIENNGIINVPLKYSVGMASTDGGTAVNNGTINVDGSNAYGMQGLNGSNLENHGVINVNGIDSRGITAIDGTTVLNTGTINVNGTGAEGVYMETRSTVDNQGIIYVNGAGRTGIFVGTNGIIINEGSIQVSGGGSASITGQGSIINIGDITIDGPTVSIDGVTITNTGTITINGALDFSTVKISGNGTNDYVGTINAETFDNGQFIVLSDVTQGSNKDMYVIQYLQGTLNAPNNGNITAISQSVSYVVDIQKDPNNSNNISLVLVKIPYIKMMEGTSATEFAKGLDELYTIASGRELEMFDSLDYISSDDELASTFENELRGNEYANIQDRMQDISTEFNQAYDDLKHNRIHSKESTKIGLIGVKGESKYKNPAIINYDQRTIGIMALKEYDTRTYGQKYGWHIGFAQNKFEFDTDSKETAYSLNMGLSYERYLGIDRLKWQIKGDLTVNHHEMDRKMDISGRRYWNNSKYWSGMATIQNKIRYERVDENGRIRAGIQGTFDLGYGRYFDIKEKGDGLHLKIPTTNMYMVRPGIGADITFTARSNKRGGRFSIKGKAAVEYELGRIYDDGNKAKFKNTSSGYYHLEEPKRERAIGKFGVELKYEHKAGNAVSFEVSRQEGRRDYTRYGINFMIRLDDY